MSIPHTSEDLRNYTTYAIVGESASMFWVGDAPRLSTDDDAVSYVQIGPNVSTGIATVTFAPFAVTGDVTLRARVRVFGGDFFGSSTLFLSDEAGPEAVDFLFEDHVIPTGSWQTIESTFTQAEMSGGLDGSAAAGTLTAGIFPGYVLDETYYWVSLLTIGGRPVPLQWRQRTDELGVSGVRPSRHASTYYATNRARGML